MTTADVEERAPLLKHSSNGTPKDNHGEVHYKNISGTRFWCLFLSIVTAYTLVSFDAFFMASSHPVITSYFNASNAAPWLTTVFFLTSTIFGPFYGRISDVTGRRSVYIFTLCVFAITTAWCGAANSIGSFIGARLFCGLGAGGVMGIASVILSDIVKVQYRGIYQSYINMGAGAGSSMGAAFGGVICEALGWRAAFYIQVPLIVVLTGFAVWATPRHLGPSLAKAEGKTAWQGMRSFDFGGAVMLSLCLSGFILGINLGGSILPWGHPVVTVSLAMFALAGLGLVSVERRASRPLLPLGLLSSVPYGNLNWGNLLGSALTASTSFNIPLFLQAVKLATPTQSGLMLLPSLAGGIGTAVCVGFAIARTRQLRPFIATGAIVQFAGTLACGFLQDHMSIVVLLLIIPWTTVGQGFWFPTTTVATLAMTEPEEQAVVVTTLNLSRSLGSIIGVAVSSWILQNALLWFLPRYVTGDAETRSRIIFEVRRSIQAIGRLGAGHRKEAIQAYAASLRAAFLGCAVLGLVLCILVLPVRIPKLQKEGGEQVAAAAEEGHSSADAALDV